MIDDDTFVSTGVWERRMLVFARVPGFMRMTKSVEVGQKVQDVAGSGEVPSKILKRRFGPIAGKVERLFRTSRSLHEKRP